MPVNRSVLPRILTIALLATACGDDETAAGATGGAGGSGAAGGHGGAAGGSSGAGGAGGAAAHGGAGGGTAGASGAGGASCTPGEPAYAFESRFEAAASSVDTGGQIWRHVAILDLVARIDGLTARIENDTLQPAPGDVVAELDFFLRFDPENGNQPIGLSTTPPPLQSSYDELATDKNLIDKLAGNDAATDHEDWDDGSSFVGWPGAASPTALVDAWFGEIEANAIAHANAPRTGPGGVALPVHVTDAGLDLKQLVQKFLTGAIAYSQGTDDYLDDDVDGKGLRSPNTRDGDSAYTVLEHAWDEAFGYFGAALDYPEYSDDEIAGSGGRPDWKGYHDTDCDGTIDLLREYNFGHSTNAAKRDLGSQAPTDYTADAFQAFHEGRTIIAAAGETLAPAEADALAEQRDQAVLAWERAIAASVVHYVNEVLVDIGKIGGTDYDYLDHVKHWGELKGFALVLQFNPDKRLSDADFSALHGALGQAPVLEADGAAALAAYADSLRAARTILGDAYDFDPANLGDADGAGGW
jgi:hypothetical protein